MAQQKVKKGKLVKEVKKAASPQVGKESKPSGISVKALASVLSMCRPFAAKRAMFPVMQHFCVRGKQIMATDGMFGISASLSVPLPEGMLPGEMLSKLAGSFSDDQEVRLSSEGDGRLRVEAGTYSATVATYPAEDFPSVAVPERKDRMLVVPDAFETLRKVRFCCTPEGEGRIVLGSVMFDKAGRGHATTGVTFAWRRTVAKKGQASFTGLVPGRLMDCVAGWGAPAEWAVDKQGKFWLFFSDPDRAVFSVCLSEKFPDVEKLVDGAQADVAAARGFIPDGSFAAAVCRALALSGGEQNSPIRLALDGITLTVSASGSAEGCSGEAAERVSVKPLNGAKETLFMTVNGAFLLDAAGRCEEFFFLPNALAGFAEDRAFGHLIAALHG